MTMSALIMVRLAEGVVGLTAGERFKAVRNLDSGGSFMTSGWFTVAMVILLLGSVAALAAVGWYKKRAARREVEESASAKRDAGKPAPPAVPVGQSRPAPAAISSQVKPQAKSSDARPKEVSVRGSAYIALYSFSRKLESPAEGAKPERPLPQFLPAKVLTVTGKVVSVETALPANVGDRVLVVIESQSNGEGTGRGEIIEDMGVVRQSAQPAQTTDAPNVKRLSVEVAGLSESQAARLADVIPGSKKAEAVKEDASQPTGTKEQTK